MKCMYCENEATVKDYRTWDGQTGKELVCNDCFNTSNEGLLDRQHKVNEAKKEIFESDLSELAEQFLQKGWNEMWTTINAEMDEHKEDVNGEFESITGHNPHQSTIENWDENILAIIDKLIKKS